MRGHQKATFSICAVDPAAQEVGCAVQSRYFAVGSVVPWAKAGVGAVATQAAGVAAYGPQALELLEDGARAGRGARRACSPTTRARDAAARRGRRGRPRRRAHRRRVPRRGPGHRVGDGYAVQGNILAGEAVVVEMERAFLETGGSLAERLVSCSRGRRRRPAATRAGSSRRRSSSSGSAPPPQSREGIDRVCELRVEDHPTPIAELRRLLGIHLVWDALRRASLFHAPGRYARGRRRCCARRSAVTATTRCCSTTWRASSRSPARPRRRSRTSRARSSSTRGCDRRGGRLGLRRAPVGPALRGTRQLGSPAAWTSTSTRARSSSAASGSRSRTAGSRPRRRRRARRPRSSAARSSSRRRC